VGWNVCCWFVQVKVHGKLNDGMETDSAHDDKVLEFESILELEGKTSYSQL
jgi:hypothetical protein